MMKSTSKRRSSRPRLLLMPRISVLLCALALVLISGCNLHFDLDSVELVAADAADGDLDARDSADGESPGDVAQPGDADGADERDSENPDAADPDATGIDAEGDADGSDDAGQSQCSVDPGEVVGACGPNRPEACGADQTCRLRLDTGNFRFYTDCVDNADGPGNRAEGEFCQGGSSCQPGLDCAAWKLPVSGGPACAKLCVLETGLGCDSLTEFCTNPSPDSLSGLGFCAKRCDPNDDRDECGPDATCTPDFGYPEATCRQNFRCLLDSPGVSKNPGDPCSRAANHVEGCGAQSGLTCVPKGGDEICVKPCSEDSDCPDSGQCTELGDGWDFKFCEL
jgi:hypothetical protein